MDLGFVPRSVAERAVNGHGDMIKEWATSIEDAGGLSGVYKKLIQSERESGFLDNWYFELPVS